MRKRHYNYRNLLMPELEAFLRENKILTIFLYNYHRVPFAQMLLPLKTIHAFAWVKTRQGFTYWSEQNRRFVLKQLDNKRKLKMMKKEIKITPPDGFEIDKENSTFECIKFKKIGRLPKSWEELGTIEGWYIDGGIVEEAGKAESMTQEYKDVFPTKELAEASLALAQLTQLRDRYNGDWEADWEMHNSKDVIYYYLDKLEVGMSRTNSVLNFKSARLRDEFLKNFKDLIEQAKPLL